MRWKTGKFSRKNERVSKRLYIERVDVKNYEEFKILPYLQDNQLAFHTSVNMSRRHRLSVQR